MSKFLKTAFSSRKKEENMQAQPPKEVPDKRNLSELQKQIYKNAKVIQDSKELELANDELDKRISERKNILEQAIESADKTKEKQKNAALKEIEGHSKLVAGDISKKQKETVKALKEDHIAKQKAEIEAAKEAATTKEAAAKEAAKAENTYSSRRDLLFNVIEGYSSNPNSLNRILAAINLKEGKKSLSIKDKADLTIGGLGSISGNVISTAWAYGNRKYYENELKKITKGEEGAEKSFFAELLKDEKTIEFVKQNSQKLSVLINTIGPNLVELTMTENDYIKKKAAKLGLDSVLDKFKIQASILELTPEIIKKDILPTINEATTLLLSNPAQVIGTAKAMLDYTIEIGKIKKQEEATGEKLVTQRNNTLVKVIDPVMTMVEKLLSDEKLQPIVDDALKSNWVKGQLAKQGIEPELVSNAIPLISKAASGLTDSKVGVITIASEVINLQNALNNSQQGFTSSQEDSIKTIIKEAHKIVKTEKISETLNKNLPKFLTDNKENIAGFVAKWADKKPNLAPLNQDKASFKNIVLAGVDVLADTLPTVHELVATTLENPNELAGIISGIKELIDAPLENQGQALEGTRKKAFKTKQNETKQKLVSDVIGLLDKDDKKLRNLLENELPTKLEANKEKLTTIIDGLVKTKTGDKLKIETGKIIEIAAKHLPALIEIADLYNKKEYAKMLPKVLKLATKKNVLSVAVETFYRVKKHKKSTTGALEETLGKNINNGKTTPEVIKGMDDKNKALLTGIKEQVKSGGHINNGETKAPLPVNFPAQSQNGNLKSRA